MSTINIARDFSRFPGPRFIEEGDHSGEAFREQILRPAFEVASTTGERVMIELDGARFGYPTSFLEEAFGGLARQVGIKAVQEWLVFVSSEDSLLVGEIHRYIRDANKTSSERRASA